MPIDYTKLRRKLAPEPEIDGDPGVRLRTGTVSAVNLDGTVNLNLNGVVIPNVPVISGVTVMASQVVQVISFRGSLIVLGGTGNKMVLRKSGDQNLTLNNTTAQAVTDMAFTGQANAIYLVKLLLTYTGNVNQDIKVSWTGPSGVDITRWVLAPASGATDYQNMSVAMMRRSAGTEQAAGAPSTTNGFVTYQEDTVVTMSSTGGTVQLWAAQNSAGSSSPNTSVRGGSLMMVERIG